MPSPSKIPSRKSLATDFVKEFRRNLELALSTVVDAESGLTLRHSVGVYGFFDYDDEPIYVGQSNESLGTRVQRHLTGQRSDTVAYRILDPFEVAGITLWPTEDVRPLKRSTAKRPKPWHKLPPPNMTAVEIEAENARRKRLLNAFEYSMYLA